MSLTFMGPTFDASGYAEALRSILFDLLQLKYQIRVIPRDWSQLDAGLPFAKKQELEKLCHSEIFPEGPIIQICEAQDFRPVPGRFNIGLTMLESDRLPQHWIEKCNQMDQVWVPSTFNRQTFINSGVKSEKIRVVPLGVNINRFHPKATPMDVKQSQTKFIFLSNFEWVPRKGYDLLMRAYLEEFTHTDPVVLIMKTYDGSGFDPTGANMYRDWNKLIESANIKHPPAIEFITKGMHYNEMPSFYTAGNCYIIPTRGEGWNLPALEAMASGIPVITTNWSAHLDFVNEENGYLIGVERLEQIPKRGIANDEIYDGAQWAVPSLSDIRKWMRHAVEHPEELMRKGKLARQDVIRQWSTAKMIERIVAILGPMEG